jgi:hypothetical protein
MPIAINGAGTITGITAGGLPDASIVAADIATDAITNVKVAAGAVIATSKLSGAVTAIASHGLGALASLATVGTSQIDANAVTLAEMAGGVDGSIITFDASGDPVAVGPGTDGQVLTSTGAGSPPAFEAAAGGGATFSVKRGSRNMTTASGNQDFTGMGFQPIAAIVMCAADNSKNLMVSIGYKDFVGGGTGMIYQEKDNTSGQWQFYYIPTAQMEQSSSGKRQVASCTALSDGIRLSWVKSGSTAGQTYTSFVMGMK